MPANMEIERKFIIEYPDTEYLKSIAGCTYSHIEQVYLLDDGKSSRRIRKRGHSGNWTYYYTQKHHITDITRHEEERVISEDEYLALKKQEDTELVPIIKTRYCIPFCNHILEIDVFPFWHKQAYLEIELDSEDEEFCLPEYIRCIREVTTDRRYTNRALAKAIPQEDL